MKNSKLNMEEQLDRNTTVIEVDLSLELIGNLISDFTNSCYSNIEITREYEMKDDTVIRFDFGYKIDGVNRFLGTLIYKVFGHNCRNAIIIKHYAKENLIEYLGTSNVSYKILEE